MARAKGITGNLEIIAAAVSQKNALAAKPTKRVVKSVPTRSMLQHQRARKKAHPATTVSRETAQKIAINPAAVKWVLVKSNKNNKNVQVVRIFLADLGFTYDIPPEGYYLQLRNHSPSRTSCIASYNGMPILNLSADHRSRILDHLRVRYSVNLFGESNVTLNTRAVKVEPSKAKVESIATSSTRESRRARLVELLREMASIIESAV